MVVHLSPAPVVAKVAASTTAARPDPAAWLQRELDVTGFLAGQGLPVVMPSPDMPATVQHGNGQVMSFWRYVDSDRALPGEDTIGSCCGICIPRCGITRPGSGAGAAR